MFVVAMMFRQLCCYPRVASPGAPICSGRRKQKHDSTLIHCVTNFAPGITCSDMHSTELLKHLLGMVKNAMMDPDDALFRTEFADAQTTAGKGTKRKQTGKETTGDGKNTGKALTTGQGEDTGKKNKGELMNKLKAMMAGYSLVEHFSFLPLATTVPGGSLLLKHFRNLFFSTLARQT